MTVNELIKTLLELDAEARKLPIRLFYFSGDRNCTEEIQGVSADIDSNGNEYIELKSW